MDSPKARILLVEDEALIGLAEVRLLTGAGYGVVRVSSGEEAVTCALDGGFDLVLMDINLGKGIDGGEAARRIGEGGGAPVIFLSSHTEAEVIGKTKDSGGYGYIVKGWGEKVLLTSIEMALNRVAGSSIAAEARERVRASRQRATLTALAESERGYRLLAENAGDVIWTLDLASGKYTYISPSITQLRGLSVKEALAESLESSLTPESFALVHRYEELRMKAWAAGDMEALTPITDIYEQPCADGSIKSVEITTSAVADAEGRIVKIVGVSRDATNRVRAEAALQEALEQKNTLFAELQHRVKNSLALIASLLSLGADSYGDERTRSAFDVAQARIQSIALLYERLYTSGSVDRIDLGAYLAEVGRSVVETLSGPGREVRYESGCETVEAGTDRAVPAGLLLHELLVNALKHAFPDGRRGNIRVALGSEPEGLRLEVADDGVGLPPGFVFGPGAEGGFGSLIVSQLVVQLKGGIEAGPGPTGTGTRILVRFPR